jgi:Zn-dependent protease
VNWQDAMLSWLPWVPAFLLSISVHESAHAWMAMARGDNTAASRGRISLYPPRHVDLFGTILLPILSGYVSNMQVIYGFAKPTPVDPAKLKRPKADFSLVAAAGPISNLILALLSALLGRLLLPFAESMQGLLLVLKASVEINLILGMINLLPLPGFDGMKILYVLLPDTWCWRISRAERWGLFLLFFASYWGIFNWIWIAQKLSLNFVAQWVGFPQ